MLARHDRSEDSMRGMPRLRVATEGDVPVLAALFRAAVLTCGPSAYAPEQVAAWAATADGSRFKAFILGPRTLVLDDETGPVGFAGWRPDGHVASLYVRPDRMRHGLGRRLLAAVVSEARAAGLRRLHTEASAFSRPVFEQAGFILVGTEVVERGGVAFERPILALDLI